MSSCCASTSYFGALATDANACFRETYHGFHGDRAPVLGALGQSTYEGMHTLATLMGDGWKDWREHCGSAAGPVVYRSARQGSYVSNSDSGIATFMARTDGTVYRVIEKIHEKPHIGGNVRFSESPHHPLHTASVVGFVFPIAV